MAVGSHGTKGRRGRGGPDTPGGRGVLEIDRPAEPSPGQVEVANKSSDDIRARHSACQGAGDLVLGQRASGCALRAEQGHRIRLGTVLEMECEVQVAA